METTGGVPILVFGRRGFSESGRCRRKPPSALGEANYRAPLNGRNRPAKAPSAVAGLFEAGSKAEFLGFRISAWVTRFAR
jgi:hypothetical protein